MRAPNELQLHYDDAQQDCVKRNIEDHFNNNVSEVQLPPRDPRLVSACQANTKQGFLGLPSIGGSNTFKVEIDKDLIFQILILALVVAVVLQYSCLVRIEGVLASKGTQPASIVST